MKKVGLSVAKIVISLCFVIVLFFHLAENVIDAANAYWCKNKNDMYELQYDNDKGIQDDIDANPGSYWGMCDIFNDLGAYLGGDQKNEGNFAQKSDELAFCHYEAGTWYQMYEVYPAGTGYRKGLMCKWDDKKSTYKTQLKEWSKLDDEVAKDPKNSYGACDPADDPKEGVWCEYKKDVWKTQNDTPAAIDALFGSGGYGDFYTSHRGGCTYHEWHTNDYLGHCTDTGINDSTVAPAPPSDKVKEKREGPGVGDGHTTGKRGTKPRIRYKSKINNNPK